MTPYLWSQTHVPSWVKRSPIPTNATLEPRTLVGEDDADTEWNHGDKTVGLFVSTPTYDSLKRTDALYLFGRRGTGKTAMLRMLQHEIREGELQAYSRCWIIQTEYVADYFKPLLVGAKLSSLSPDTLMKLCRDTWLWLFKLAAMLDIVIGPPKPGVHGSDIDHLRRFLAVPTDPALIDRNKLTQLITAHASRRLAAAVRRSETPELIPGNYADELQDESFQQTELALHRILAVSAGLCLIAIDAGETYAVRQESTEAMLNGLIDAIRVTYKDRSIHKLVAKAAFPSEIQPYLSPQNHDKFDNHTTVIAWRYQDILLFVAKRFRQLLHTDVLVGDFTSFGEAEAWLYSVFPRNITTRSGFSVDALAYIIRHTQKKPRQIIHLLNAILTLAAVHRADIAKLYRYPELVVNGTQIGLPAMIKGVLGVYEMIYQNAPQMLRAVVGGSEAWFPGNALGRLLKQASPFRGNSISTEELKSLLFESGVLGKARSANIVNISGDPRVVLTAAFDYQVKQGAHPKSDDICVVHPMLYEELEVLVDQRVYVYPMPLEQEERMALLRMGLTLSEE